MATIADVARRARVSTYTVSAVLNRSARVSPELTRRVLKAVHELDYTINDVARSLQTRRTRTVGMLIPEIANPFYANVVRGVETVLKEQNYSLLLGITYNQAEEQSRYLMVFRSKQVDGLLLFAVPGDERPLRALIEKKRPVVFVSRRPPGGIEADCVAADNRLGARLAVDALLAQGRRRIGIITGQANLSVSAERVAGWGESLTAAGIPPDPAWVRYGEWTAESGYREALALLDLPCRPDAVFASNFLQMTGVLKALAEQRLRCPDDVAIISCDDNEWLDVFRPPISTVIQPSFDMGAEAARLLLCRINDPDGGPTQILLPPSLRLRN